MNMENTEKYTEKLAKYILAAAAIAIVCTVCWYFRNILIYILIAVVVSLIGKPVMTLLQKIRIKGRKAPDWFLATLTLMILMILFTLVFTLIVPVVSGIVKNISLTNIEDAARHVAIPLSEFNRFLVDTFPKLGEGFRIEIAALQELQKLLKPEAFSTMIGSAASFVTSIGIGTFSVVFISFFFIKDDGLFTEMITSLVPDRHETNAAQAINDIGHLLSRYFLGIIIEVTGVGLLNFLGLFFIARLGLNASLGIAFLTGILNIIPYVGPLFGGALGTVLGLILKYSSSVPIGLDVSFIVFTIILIAIFCVTQLVDNFFYQPVIYSTSIKAKPLEIFIVLLVAGHIGGPMGMIAAIPCYTVVRVIAFRFFRNIKAIRRLIPSDKYITESDED
ncbi:MAG: AI-2E family transporter [Bacteroidales bacterium]|nr:AI-2E family transporter [Bacteroidales bacterium]